MKTYKSEEILNKDDLYELQDSFYSSCIQFKYEMTDSELDWLRFVANRYSIADWIFRNLDGNTLLFNDPYEMSEALCDDGYGYKATCLSDETALQKLFFWLNNND